MKEHVRGASGDGCAEVEGALAEGGDAARHAGVVSHVAGCASCAGLAEDLATLAHGLARMPRLDVSDAIAARTLAAVAAEPALAAERREAKTAAGTVTVERWLRGRARAVGESVALLTTKRRLAFAAGGLTLLVIGMFARVLRDVPPVSEWNARRGPVPADRVSGTPAGNLAIDALAPAAPPAPIEALERSPGAGKKAESALAEAARAGGVGAALVGAGFGDASLGDADETDEIVQQAEGRSDGAELPLAKSKESRANEGEVDEFSEAESGVPSESAATAAERRHRQGRRPGRGDGPAALRGRGPRPGGDRRQAAAP